MEADTSTTVDEQQQQHEDEIMFSESQSKALSIATRIAACISFGCALYMAHKAYKSRDRMFHRLMLGLSIHLIIYSCWYMYGTAAVPSGTPGVWRPRGTIQTCTAQGFFLQVSFAIPIYYSFLSLYSFQAVRYNFDVDRYQWIEKWIHLIVHIFPLGSAFYLLHIEAFNPSGHLLCWIDSIPFGCGHGSGIECQRGPQNIEQIAWIFAGLPALLMLLFPTFVMLALYILVRRRTSKRMTYNNTPAATATGNTPTSTSHPPPFLLTPPLVAKQAGVYLLGTYWTYLWAMINNGLQWIGDKKLFATAFMAVININLMGVWILLVYRYFRVVIPKKTTTRTTATTRSTTTTTGAITRSMSSSSLTNNNKELPNIAESKNDMGDFAVEEIADDERMSQPETHNTAAPTTATTQTRTTSTATSILKSASSAGRLLRSRFLVHTGGGRNHHASSVDATGHVSRISISNNNDKHSAIPSSSPPTFNIFDGSNATGAFAQYVFDGDSEDAEEEQHESIMWSQVQSHV